MGGASVKHIRINRNVTLNTGNYLEDKDCEILNTEMRMRTPTQDAYMYPDALIVCGKLQLEDDVFDTLLNPSVIVEILSPSTRSIDKGRKFFFYQQIPALREYIMIDSLKKFIQLAGNKLMVHGYLKITAMRLPHYSFALLIFICL